MEYIKKILAFFNLLERGRKRISISHIMMWISVWMVVYMTINSPEYLAQALTALGVATTNYIAKRHINKDKE